jgi:anti-sigma factor RsiW
MNINRNNCEAFFLDYYEGTLSDAQVAEMFAFLKSNPDLREVFESFSDVSVDTDKTSTPDFSFLKKETVADVHEQAQQWMVDAVDGTIAPADKIALENYLNEYPSKRADLEAFEKTVLRPDANETLGDLYALKKEVAVTPENFEHFAVALIEGTISAHERSLLESFVLVHPEFSTMLDAFRASVEQADESIVFEPKASLKRSAVTVTEHNIGELLLAKTEGLLSAHDEQAVDAFTAAHPQYAKELALLAKTKLVADPSETFEAKHTLKRGAVLISENNFEQYAISAAEGLLNSEEQKAFNAFVASNEKYRKAAAHYSATRLQPDLSVVYDNKAELKRKEKGAVIWFTATVRYAAAAMLVILLSVYFWVKSDSTDPLEGTVADGTQQQVIDRSDETVPGSTTDVVTPDPETQLADQTTAPGQHEQVVNAHRQNDPVQDVHGTPTGTITIVSNGPPSIIAQSLPNKANDAVAFSDAAYAGLYTKAQAPADATQDDEYVSMGQLAMRWMKEQLDGKDPMRTQLQDNAVALAPGQSPAVKDRNVDGIDLTESAVNRVGQTAANGKIAMEQRNDGTYLQLWNYEVRVAK